MRLRRPDPLSRISAHSQVCDFVLSLDSEIRPSCQDLLADLDDMHQSNMAIVVTLIFSVIGVCGDYFLKLASQEKNSLRSPWFYIGFVLYASTAFGWVFVMKHLKLATVSVVYSVSMVLLLTTIGVIFFQENLSTYEVVGLAMAVGALVLLTRFS